jgi:hypothetical protein
VADNVGYTPGSGATVAAESLTINSVAALVQQVKLAFGALDTYVGQQGGRLVDGSGTSAAGFVDSRLNTVDVTKTPTISTSAYTIGYSLGGVIDFGAIARASGGGVSILSATILDKAQKNAQIDLFLFNADPSNGTYTDHAAPTVSTTDLLMCRGVISFSAYANFGTATVTTSVCSVPNVGLDIVLNGTQHLYGIMLIRTAVTYATTSDITVTLEYVPD